MQSSNAATASHHFVAAFDAFPGRCWNSGTAPDLRRDAREWLGRISAAIVQGEAAPTVQIDALVAALARWLTEDRAGILGAVHDHFGRVGLRSHALCVAVLMMNCAHDLDLGAERIHAFGVAGLLHDIGKLAVPPQILDKPGKLDAAEFAVMRGHPEKGVFLLRRCGIDDPQIIEVCRHHHERADGSGYPGGLRHEQIGLAARLCAICDVYDALISKRSYKPAWSVDQALEQLRAIGQFDPQLLEIFVSSIACRQVAALS